MRQAGPWTKRPDSVNESVSTLLGAYRADLRTIPRRARELRSVARFARLLITWTFVGAFTTALLGLTVPTFFGYHSFVVMSGSMEPTIHVGDVVVDREISPLDARVGDVVTFKDPGDSSRLITHRIRSIRIDGDSVRITTKGDAANGIQRWTVPADGRVGRVVLHLWKLGFVLFWVATRWGRMLLVVVPAAALGLYELKRIWSPKKKVADEPAA